jgi:hypothetical protein
VTGKTYTDEMWREALTWVEQRLEFYRSSQSDWTLAIASYEACAAELRGLIAAEEFTAAFSGDGGAS